MNSTNRCVSTGSMWMPTIIVLCTLLWNPLVSSFLFPLATLPSLRMSEHSGPTTRRRHWGAALSRLRSLQRNDCTDLSNSSSSFIPTAKRIDVEGLNENEAEGSLLDILSSWFQGDFDNYRQVVDDRNANLLPREGGGHEHIHCSLIPVTPTSRLAAFYFDGNPNAIFRFRFYRLQSSSSAPIKVVASDDNYVDTLLYTLDSKLELKLRSCADPLQWPGIFAQHVNEQDELAPCASSSPSDIAHVAVHTGCVTLLPRCEVRWSWALDPVQHSYVLDVFPTSASSPSGIHAVMVHGQALIDSQMMPGQKILIRDQLSLWHDELWIHDRGFNPDTLAYIYGNQRGIPYRMERVASMGTTTIGSNAADERRVTDPDLAWTLGSSYRSSVEYEQNMERIGGKSTRV